MDLGEGLRQAIAKLSRATIIDAKTIREFNRSLQKALLSADVEVQLVLRLTEKIEHNALKSNPPKGLAAKDYITNIVYEELVKLVGEGYAPEMRKKRILLMGLYGSGKCVHPDTVIPLVNGGLETASNLWNYKGSEKALLEEGSVKELDTPLEITAFDPISLKVVKTEATHVWKLKKTDPLVKVSLENGNAHSVTTTPEHPFFVLENGEIMQVRADELRQGQRVAIPKKVLFEDSVDLRKDFGVLPNDWIIEDSDIAKQVVKRLYKYGTLIEAYKKLKPPMPYCTLSAELKRKRVRGWLLNRLYQEGLRVKLPKVITAKKVASAKWVTLPLELTPQLAEFLGYVFADGNIDLSATHVTNESPEINARLLELGQKIFGFKPMFIADKRSKVGLRRTSFASITLNEYLEKTFGLIRGKKSHIMRLPASILRAPLKTSKSFLQAYFDCDGAIAKNARSIEFCTASREFALSLRLLLLKHSMHSTFSKKIANKGTYYRIFVKSADADLFATTIPSRVMFKRHRLQNCRLIGMRQSNGRHENIPAGNLLRSLRESRGATIGEIQAHCASYGIYEKKGLISRSSLKHYLACLPILQHDNREILQMVEGGTNLIGIREQIATSRGVANAMTFRLCQTGMVTQTDQGTIQITIKGKQFLNQEENGELGLLTALAESDVLWIPVKKLERVDSVEYVYDLTVPKYHNFIANGIFVHNTTSAAKLAKYYNDRGMSSALICCDVSRPAAYRQLETLARQANVPFFGMEGEQDAAKIARLGAERFKDRKVVICDTSGRSGLDGQLIEELKRVNREFEPDERVLVISADIGQVAGRQASEFNRAVGVSGVIVTKMDGSGKGGGALSAAGAAEVHVLFIGTGEKLENLEAFDPNKFIGGLLGIPDIEGLVERVNSAVRESKLDVKKLETEELNFETFYEQLEAMGKMGPLKGLFGMMGATNVPNEVMEQSEEKLKKYKIIISSMTRTERRDEKLLHQQSRIERIAKGSGTSEREVRMLVSEFNKMRKTFNVLKNDRDFKRRFKMG